MIPPRRRCHGTVTINLTNLPAGAGAQALIVPVEAVFNLNNSPRNEPHVWAGRGKVTRFILKTAR